MTKFEALNLRRFRTLTGPARKVAVREHLAALGVEFGKDVNTIPGPLKSAVADMAKVCGYRKPITCPLSLGAAFYVYLSRGVS